jgi:hypothetical protein
MFKRRFSRIRALVLDKSERVVQDASGIPFKYLQQAPWSLRLYGRYEHANHLFSPFEQRKRLFLVSSDTRDKTAAYCAKLPFAVTRSSIPETDDRFTAAERRARLLHLHSQHEHTRMIAGGAVLPLLLKLTPLRRI